MGNKKTYVEKQDEEAEKNDMCDVGGRRRNTVLDTVGYQKRCQQLARQVVPGHAETAGDGAHDSEPDKRFHEGYQTLDGRTAAAGH